MFVFLNIWRIPDGVVVAVFVVNVGVDVVVGSEVVDLRPDPTPDPTSDLTSKSLLVDFRLLHCPPGLISSIWRKSN